MKETPVGAAVGAAIAADQPQSGLRRCDRENCGGVAWWSIDVQVWAKNCRDHRDDNCALMKFGLVVCDDCRKQTQPSDVIGDEGWQQIVTLMQAQRHATPDRDSLKIVFSPLPVGGHE